MSKAAISLTVAILGLSLIAGSFYWTSPLGPRPQWNEQQARQHAEAASNYHRLAHQHTHDSADVGDPASSTDRRVVRQARENWEKQEAKLQAVRSRHNRRATTLKWSGIALATSGVTGFFLLRARSE